MTTTEEPGAELEVRPDATVETVIEAEIVDEPRERPILHRWVTARVVPTALKPAALVPAAPGARRALLTAAVRVPLVIVPQRVGRGAWVLARHWHRWVQVSNQREAAVAAKKYAEQADAIRRVSREHWKWTVWTVAGIAAAVVLVVLIGIPVPVPLRVALLTAVFLVLVVVGRRDDGAPGRKPALPSARSLSWTLDPNQITERFIEAGVIKKGQRLYLVNRPHPDGPGTAVTIDLPAGVTAEWAISRRMQLASAFAVDELRLILDRVRGDDGHAARIDMWIANSDPWGHPAVRSPLVDEPTWDIWQPIPLGTTPRARRQSLQLVWTSLLIGGRPDMGKSNYGRLVGVAGVLDPHVRMIVADGKGGRDWVEVKLLAYRWIPSDEDEHVRQLCGVLDELIADCRWRYRQIKGPLRRLCPKGKVTPEVTRDARYGMPIVVCIVDEFQNYSEHEVYGKRIVDQLAYLAKKGRASGIILVPLTQKPDKDAVPTKLRDVIGTRLALSCATWQASDSILGSGKYVQGFDASQFLRSHKGVSWLVGADGETTLPVDAGVMVRADWIELADFEEACARGLESRAAAGTLAGDATGDQLDEAAVARSALLALPRGRRGRQRVEEQEVDERDDLDLDDEEDEQRAVQGVDTLPPMLRRLVDYLADDLDPDGRTIVPTAELCEELGVTDVDLAAGLAPTGLKPGRTAQVRGYRTADVRAAVARIQGGADVIELRR